MSAILRLWRGEVPLADAFWNWAVLGGVALNITTSLMFFVLISSGWPIAALVVGYAFSVPYNILVAVGVWRSAARYEGPPRLASLARIVTLVGMTLLSMT